MEFPFSTEFNKTLFQNNHGLPRSVQTQIQSWRQLASVYWRSLETFRTLQRRGYPHEQYAMMLKPHFLPMVWAHIYKDHISTKLDPTSRAFSCRTVLHLYILECYTFEARVRDYKNFTAGEDPAIYSQSAMTFNSKFVDIYSKSLYRNYADLVQITRHWSPSEQSQFFSLRRCLNYF